MSDLGKLLSVMQEARAYLALESNDFSWSSWIDQDHALAEIDAIITDLQHGSVPDMVVLFVPTGPIQEVSLSSGWADEFINLAQRFDEAYTVAKE